LIVILIDLKILTILCR